MSYENAAPREIRYACREGNLTTETCGMAMGFAQANLVILPEALAYDFLLFCTRNPKPCPLLEVSDVGSPILKRVADGADVRTDLPRYRIFERGMLIDEPTSIVQLWKDDSIAFLLGCSFTFEQAMLAHGLPVRHIEEGKNVPMYRTTLDCEPAGRFAGKMVVSMRPLPSKDVVRTVEVTGRYHKAHGAPIHIGQPEAIGIIDIKKPDFGDPVSLGDGEVPVFWACGVTPQSVVTEVKPSLAITHAPGHMLVCDMKDEELAAE